MTPAETIRKAATLLRERAEKAPRSPWWPDLSPEFGTVVAHAEHPDDIPAGGSCVAFFAYPDDEERRAYQGAFDTAAYIAGMHPGVARDIADLLDMIAEEADRYRDSDPCLCVHVLGWHKALKLAREVLGEQDGDAS